MRNQLTRILTLTAVFLFTVTCLVAQVDSSVVQPIDIGDGSLGDFLNLYNALYAGLVLLAGYAAKMFKVKIKTTYLTVLAAAVILAVIFVTLGLTEGISVAFSFFAATNIYDLIKGFTKKKPDDETGANG